MMGNGANNNTNIDAMQLFNQFRQTVRTNPQKKVTELLQSGQMSNEQFQTFQQRATQFQKMFNIK